MNICFNFFESRKYDLLPLFVDIEGIVFRTNINAQVRHSNFLGFRRESGGK
jgi:hypothetical protein